MALALFILLGARQTRRPESVLPPPTNAALVPAATPTSPAFSTSEGEAPPPGRRVPDEQLGAQLPPGADLTE